MSLWQAFLDFVYGLFGYRRVVADELLTTLAGNPLQGLPITLYWSKGSNYQQDGTGITISTGEATESLYLKHGNYDFYAVFLGTNIIKPVTAQQLGVHV